MRAEAAPEQVRKGSDSSVGKNRREWISGGKLERENVMIKYNSIE